MARKTYKHALIVMDQTGDTRTLWDERNVEMVENARSVFDAFRSNGYTAFAVYPEQQNETWLITEFEENAPKIVMTPRMVGG